ncbi:hypothetical protein CDL12_16937 [Handroanthus impetiginosus]|uniref:Uncharacterized protein n=1 Tax=Handroanthus impetiginosus TaxID=429701 RepID=A0A2G9GYW4_9LAMI|nr:hypothetical protein CDL12_16937 [Handroanthus impetiginosus]
METFWVTQHLYSNDFMANYENWTAHGEELWGNNRVGDVVLNENRKERNSYMNMVMDVVGNGVDAEDNNMEEEPNPSAKKFYDLLKDADDLLWDGCTKHTILLAMTQLLNLKS